jgi:UDP-N-acetylmuramate dehydrogenase
MVSCKPEPKLLMGSQFSTYRIGGVLDEAYQPQTEDAALQVVTEAQTAQKKLTILGWGGNTIIASQGIRGVTLITRKLESVCQHGEQAFWFGAGVHLAKAANVAMQHSLAGGEFMIGIPGTVGGAIFMNAGAQETANVVQRVRLYNAETQQVEEWEAQALGFAYRKSTLIPGVHTVLSALLGFTPGDKADIEKAMQSSVHFRKQHHPKEPNGGSVFKNPSKDMPVGRLMDELGAKGAWKEGGVMVSPLHGNFIINTNHGTSTDLLRLMFRMKSEIYQRYHVDVYPENLLVGDITATEQALWQQLKSPL